MESEKENVYCPCTSNCTRRGYCSLCVAHHAPKSFPACFFTTEGEALHNRSFDHLVIDRKKRENIN